MVLPIKMILAPLVFSCALLASSTSGQSQTFSGLENEALGNASLEVLNTSDSFLRVSNLGASGLDGVRVHHSGLDGLDLEFGPVLGINNGVIFNTFTMGRFGLSSIQPLTNAHVRANGGGLELYASFPTLGAEKRVELWLDGALVAEFDGVTSDLIGIVQAGADPALQMIRDFHVEAECTEVGPMRIPQYTLVSSFTWNRHWVVDQYGPISFLMPQLGMLFDCDEVRIKGAPLLDEFLLEHTDILLGDIGQFDVIAEGAHHFDHRFLGSGAGHVLGVQVGNDLTLGPDSSGLASLAVDLSTAPQNLIHLAGLPSPLAMTSASLIQMQLRSEAGSSGSVYGTLLGRRASATRVRIAADFSVLGSTQVEASFLSGGVVVHNSIRPAGAHVFRADTWFNIADPVSMLSPGFNLRWAQGVEMTVIGSQQVDLSDIDEVRVAPVAPTLLADVSVLELTTTDLGPIQLTDVTALTPGGPCGDEILCPSTQNSSGEEARICVQESSFGAVELSVTGVPATPGLFFHAPDTALAPFGNGFRCIGGGIVRGQVQFATGGVASDTLDMNSYINEWRGHQYWYRDSFNGFLFNTSDARGSRVE